MQPMQDKEFDQLFKNAFDHAEITPSRDLWSNIEADLQPKKNKKLPFYWLAAAVVLVMATITLVLNSQKVEKVQIAKQNPINTASDLTVGSAQTVPNMVVKEDSIPKLTYAHAVTPAPKEAKQKIRQVTGNLNQVNTDLPIKPEQSVVKIQEVKPEVSVKQQTIPEPQVKEETVLAAAAHQTEKPEETVKENEETETKGIRNVGDLVNLVVNKVDKRKDKFIQFRTDDDDSSLASINIGPFKFGKRNKNK